MLAANRSVLMPTLAHQSAYRAHTAMQSHEVHDGVAASRSLSLPMPSKMQMPTGSIAEEREVARKISVTLAVGTRLVIYEMLVVAPRYAKRHIVSEGGNVLHQCQT